MPRGARTTRGSWTVAVIAGILLVILSAPFDSLRSLRAGSEREESGRWRMVPPPRFLAVFAARNDKIAT